MLTQYANVLNLLRSRVVLAPAVEPEDGRVLQLFRNRAELKKAFGNAQDEIHRLRDRIKLQEGATVRVKELLEALEARLSAPDSGMQALVHYQLRALWLAAQSRIETIVRDLQAQREELERRQFAAEHNRRTFEIHQSARRRLAEAERDFVDVKGKLGVQQQQLGAAGAWWHYFRRKALQRKVGALMAEQVAVEMELAEARSAVEEIDRAGAPDFPGISLEARRAINIAAIAYAHLILTRLSSTRLVDAATDAMSRAQPRENPALEGASPLAVMNDIARARTVVQSSAGAAVEVKQLSDQLREVARYSQAEDTVPTAESLDPPLLAAGPKQGEGCRNVLREDLWGLSSVLL